MEKEPLREREQSREEILEILAEAIETGRKVMITQITSDGQIVQNSAEPISLQNDRLEVESDGFGFSIDVSMIKKVEK